MKDSLKGVISVLLMPKYLLLALVFSLLISVFIYFFINISFFGSLFVSSLPIIDKLSLFWMLVVSTVSSYTADLSGLLLLILSILQGIALMLLIYNFKQNRKLNRAVMARGGLATVAAVIGLGCVPCGTSLLIPIMTLIFASSAPALLDTANTVILIMAGLLSAYAVYSLGKVSYTNKMMKDLSGGDQDE